ncbi:peptide chain release factor 2 [Oxobacter pfennigii]|uniref:Peptide chain release factor 2 n=2 Tax=Oxobacter pfennigii TaxID=36849 RepID=A0A0P8YYC6_9CLOT|nr:peptide chain release factor 2 [Oxobacter pfennigii]
MSEPDFWNDIERAQSILQASKTLKSKIEKYDSFVTKFEDFKVLLEICEAEEDKSMLPEVEGEFKGLINDLESFRIETLLTGEYDKNNAILALHAGAGGTEAQDWVSMLYRMYVRWAEGKSFKVETIDYLAGDEAGIKSVTIKLTGENAYGYLKSEKGVHRLVRISPFDAAGKRHTSFASCEVLPELTKDQDINIRPEDLKIDTYRSSGAGGQHVNKTESAIRITHLPTGIIVACQNERSQHSNKETAMNMLKAKLLELKERAHMEKIEDLTADQKDIGWGSQIRSYVFQPYTMVKDHRTGAEVGNINAVMDGDIDIFINAYLKGQVASGKDDIL